MHSRLTLFRGNSSLTWLQHKLTNKTLKHLHILDVRCICYHSKCGAQYRDRMRKKTTTMIFPFPVFQLWFVCCIRFFPIQLEFGYLFLLVKKKPQMNWCGEIEDFFLALFSNYILLFFRFLFLFLFCFSLRVLIWFSRVRLNHSLLTYKVYLNKHVQWFLFFNALALALVRACVWLHDARAFHFTIHCTEFIVFLRLNWWNQPDATIQNRQTHTKTHA